MLQPWTWSNADTEKIEKSDLKRKTLNFLYTDADNVYMHSILRNGRWYIIDIYLKIVIKTWIIVAHLKSICDA